MVIDDHPLFAEAMAQLLRGLRDGLRIEMAADLGSALARIADGGPFALIICDLGLPDASGPEVVARLRASARQTRLLAVLERPDWVMDAAAMRAGADLGIAKTAPLAAFRMALAGLVQAKADGHADRLASLTPQQARILALICEGKLNKQIAYELSIAEPTVKTHVTAILRKLGVHRRTQAVLLAQKAGFTWPGKG
nr:response regulator transcription factor [Marivita sp. GX14005]